MHRQRHSSILSLVGILLAGWLSLACGHCWAAAGAAPPPADHCQHMQPEPQSPECCEHEHQGGLCPVAEVGSGPITEPAALIPAGFPDQPALQPGGGAAWQAWRGPPPTIAAVRTCPPASASLYLRDCAFLE
ncbi:hypothetical protein TspCOW1_22320 [Thiohalobacter sp. COW1]|uniref:Acyl-CoA synthetases (AMP-forming)/AMP-acid ligases II n=1 Tax=Thiohalobacter thiocyanaticus TaxID=585455 RepID=A0A1Z4VMR5_9GAMM|nr:MULTISPECIES: hypothetical protein [Thiohalobacter]BAZ92910.1 acyl-CoA synthetases (AMP-forming)/AMP-acid ligases II [Thiohalobacter thiocyanaticus]BCO32129.1 hypothetical protein TspCOW1_22320 [Thiohalobacter sp. COW1]